MRPLLVALLFALLAPLTRAAPPFFFIQLSDPQMGMFADNANFTQDAANFEFAVAAVNRLRPAFVVITGDLVNKAGDATQIAEFRRIVGKIDAAIPVHLMPGNHDVANVPTPATLAAYTALHGPDHYVFRHGDFVGLVLNSTVIHTPTHASAELAAQDRWLRAELAKAKADGAKHLAVIQHHPWFLKTADEPDQYFNIPLARRTPLLALFRESGVRTLISGHYHRNAEAADGALAQIVTGAVSKPLGGSKSGLRVFIVRDEKIESRFHDFGDLPVRVDLAPAAATK
ncbi:MAG: hypothetical protein RLZZ15_4455 [Verrucomicrobiota bacterium]